MKKSALVLSIISAILAAFAVVFLILTPTILKDFSYMTSTTAGANAWQKFSESVLANWVDFHKNAIDPTWLKASADHMVCLYLVIALGVLLVIWILHLVFLIVKKRVNALPVNIIYLVFGLVSWDLLYIGLYPGYFTTSQGKNVFDIINALKDATTKTPINGGQKTLAYLPYLLGALALGLLLAAIIISLVDVIKYPGLSKKSLQIKPAAMVSDASTVDSDINNPVFVADADATPKATNDSEIRGVLNSELTADENPDGTPAEAKAFGIQAVVDPTVPAKTTVTKDSYSGGTPTIVQYISYGAVNNNNGPVPPMMGKDKEDQPVTDEQLRRIISEELDKKVGGKVGKPLDKPVGKAAEKPSEDADVMTSDDLRGIIRDEMRKAGKPVASSTKDNEPLTTDDLRAIIAQELKSSDQPEAKKVEETESVVEYDEEPETITSDDLRFIIQEELAKNNAPKKEPEPKEDKPVVEEDSDEEATVVDQDDLVTSDDLRSIIRDELAKALKPVEAAKPEEPKPVEEPKAPSPAPEENEAVTTDELRTIIRQELDATKPVARTPAPAEEEEVETKPLTADDLRTLIQEALDEHDNPERRHLTEDEARELIVEQIRSYYLGKQKDAEAEEKAKEAEEKAKADEVKAKKEAEEKAIADAKAKEEADRKAEEDKRKAAEEAAAKKKAEEEAAAKKAEEDAKPQPLTGDELRAIIREEITANTPAPAPAPAPTPVEAKVNPDDIKNAISEELAKFRDEQKAATEKAAQDEADAQMIAQARAEAQAEESKAQSEDIKNLKANSLTPEQIRTIIAEELDKKLAEKTIVEEREPEPAPEPAPAPAPEPEPVKPEPIAEPAPAPVATEPVHETIVINVPPVAPAPAPKKVEPAPVVPAAQVAKIVRIPFPDRMVKGDKELRSNYNELKAECLSYGLKSRLSNSGDTFRLHTKTYVKITIAGKGLKIYFALNPKEYVNSPIPLHDAGGKNIYKDIPGVFKVKSSLSLKRAKQLIADACEKDNLEQGKIEAHNWAGELKDYKPQLGTKGDD